MIPPKESRKDLMLSQSGRVVLCSCHVSFWNDALFGCGSRDFHNCLVFIQELIGPTRTCEPWESCSVQLLYITINEHKEIFWAFQRLQHPTNSTELTSFWTRYLSSLKKYMHHLDSVVCVAAPIGQKKTGVLIPTSVGFSVVGKVPHDAWRGHVDSPTLRWPGTVQGDPTRSKPPTPIHH